MNVVGKFILVISLSMIFISCQDDDSIFIPSIESLYGNWEGAIVGSHFLDDELIFETGALLTAHISNDNYIQFRNKRTGVIIDLQLEYLTEKDTIILTKSGPDGYCRKVNRIIKHTPNRLIFFNEKYTFPLDSSFNIRRVTYKFSKLD